MASTARPRKLRIRAYWEGSVSSYVAEDLDSDDEALGANSVEEAVVEFLVEHGVKHGIELDVSDR